MQRVLAILATLLLAVVAVVAIYTAWPLLFPEVAQRAPLNPNCNLRAAPCSVVFPDGAEVTFSIQPDSIPVVAPLKYEVLVQGMEADGVIVDFVGVDMNMGFNRAQLNRTEAGRFVGDGMLPVCVRDVMEWEARVLIDTVDGLMEAPFRFVTTKPEISLPADWQPPQGD
jgi:hypothetical protein